VKHPVAVIKQFIPLTQDHEAQLRKICDAEVCSSCGREILRWTKEPPTIPGWYGVKSAKLHLRVARLYEVGGILYCDGDDVTKRKLSWYGPLTLPE